MANTAQLSPDELKKRIEEEKSLSGILGRSPQAEAAKIGALTKASQGQGLPSAPPADVTKAARPLTGGDSTPPPSAVGGMGPSTPPPSEVGGMGPSTPPPAENGFTPSGVATAGVRRGALEPYTSPTSRLTTQLTPGPGASATYKPIYQGDRLFGLNDPDLRNLDDTSSIPDAEGTRHKSLTGDKVAYEKSKTTQAEARNEGAKVVPGLKSSTKGPTIDPERAAEVQRGMSKPWEDNKATAKAIAAKVIEMGGAFWDQLKAEPKAYKAFNDAGKKYRDNNPKP